MEGQFWRSFKKDTSGATAALYVLALPALVAVAGIGFDYAQLASMDTELQNAADQAALAGATQLDQGADSISRAVTAVQGGLVTNFTLFANDGQSDTVDIPTNQIYFYATRADAEAGINPLDTSDADSNAEARFIRVVVETRTANFALTPVVGAFSEDLNAEAVAGIGAALCRTPPLMICNPAEPASNTDKEYAFNPNTYTGLGLLLKGGGGSAWAPGNFGFLDTIPGTGGGTPDLRKALGWDSPIGECISQTANDAVDTDTGNKTDIADSMNTRFDIYNGDVSCPTGGTCSPSANSMKDFVHPGSLTDTQACKVGSSGWMEGSNPYEPATNAPLDLSDPSTLPEAMGHPRDICHATATNLCDAPGSLADNGPFGDGVWDRDAYFMVHYGWNNSEWTTNTSLDSTATRYEVYSWEMDNRGNVVDGVTVLGGPSSAGAYGGPVCNPSGIVPSDTVADRRRLSVAVINCVAYNVRGSSKSVPVQSFMDVFLVQPSLARGRTQKDEIYVEVIGETARGSAGETAGTVIRRDVPYLIR